MAPAKSVQGKQGTKNLSSVASSTTTGDTGITVEIRHVRGQLEKIEEDLEVLHKIMHGNGTMGIHTKVELLWKTYNYTWTVVGTSIGFFVGWCLRAWAFPT